LDHPDLDSNVVEKTTVSDFPLQETRQEEQQMVAEGQLQTFGMEYQGFPWLQKEQHFQELEGNLE